MTQNGLKRILNRSFYPPPWKLKILTFWVFFVMLPLLTNIPDAPDVYVALEPQLVSEEDEYGQVTLRCELASGHPAIITNVTWYKVNQDFQSRHVLKLCLKLVNYPPVHFSEYEGNSLKKE